MRRVLAVLFTLLAGPAWAQANPSFNVANRGNQAINEIYATPAGVDRWGRDRLQQSFLPPGQTFPVRLPPDGNCIYDIRVVYADGRPEEKRRINTCQVDAVAFPGGQVAAGAQGGRAPARGGDGGDPSFRLVNRGRAEVNQLFVSLPSQDSWGKDRLGDDTVPAGSTRVIQMPQGECTWDVRVVFASGEATERRRVDLCNITDLRVP